MAMGYWFECKVRYEKTLENGTVKKVTEPYLVDAMSFTEAEARIIREMSPFMSGEWGVADIKRANFSELFPSDEETADRWYKIKLATIIIDEKKEVEKKVTTWKLVQAANLKDAIKKLDENMKGSLADYELTQVAETSIVDVYFYEELPKKKA